MSGDCHWIKSTVAPGAPTVLLLVTYIQGDIASNAGGMETQKIHMFNYYNQEVKRILSSLWLMKVMNAFSVISEKEIPMITSSELHWRQS